MTNTTAYTLETDNEVIEKQLLRHTTSDEDCCYHEPLGNSQLSGGREIKITLTVTDAARPDPLSLVETAIRDYHYALDMRQHGGVAQDKAIKAIESALNLHWRQGEELARRKKLDRCEHDRSGFCSRDDVQDDTRNCKFAMRAGKSVACEKAL